MQVLCKCVCVGVFVRIEGQREHTLNPQALHSDKIDKLVGEFYPRLGGLALAIAFQSTVLCPKWIKWQAFGWTEPLSNTKKRRELVNFHTSDSSIFTGTHGTADHSCPEYTNPCTGKPRIHTHTRSNSQCPLHYDSLPSAPKWMGTEKWYHGYELSNG